MEVLLKKIYRIYKQCLEKKQPAGHAEHEAVSFLKCVSGTHFREKEKSLCL